MTSLVVHVFPSRKELAFFQKLAKLLLLLDVPGWTRGTGQGAQSGVLKECADWKPSVKANWTLGSAKGWIEEKCTS